MKLWKILTPSHHRGFRSHNGFPNQKKVQFCKIIFRQIISAGSIYLHTSKWTFWHIFLVFFIFLNIVQNANSFPLLLQSKDFLSKPGFLCTLHVKICSGLEIKQKRRKNEIICFKNKEHTYIDAMFVANSRESL